MKQYLEKVRKLLTEVQPGTGLYLAQRGDSGTIYIVFIMAIIIGASYVMVDGLSPTFADLGSQQNTQNNFVDDNPNDGLPPIPLKGSPEYEKMKACAEG